MSGGTEPVRIGLAGCGRIAERGYLPALLGAAGARLAAVADPDSGRRERLSAEWARAAAGDPPAAFADAREMLGSGRVDALVVASPAPSHVEVATAASAAAVPALVEKPPAPDLAGARALAALDRPPAIGFNRRFLQGAELGPRMPGTGWLELDLELRFRREGWGSHVSADDALLDAGLHLVDLARFLAGSVAIAVRRAAVAPERAELEVELGRGRVRLRCSTEGRYAERVEVHDRGGNRVGAHRMGPLRARLAGMRAGESPLALSLRRQLEAFAAGVGGQTPDPRLASADDGVAALAAAEAARRSAELGGAQVTVSEPGSVPGAAP